jgi:hypothetical protein
MEGFQTLHPNHDCNASMMKYPPRYKCHAIPSNNKWKLKLHFVSTLSLFLVAFEVINNSKSMLENECGLRMIKNGILFPTLELGLTLNLPIARVKRGWILVWEVGFCWLIVVPHTSLKMGHCHCQNHCCVLCDLKEVQIGFQWCKREIENTHSTMMNFTLKWSH